VSIAHVLKNYTIYEKPWQSRRLITSLIGCGLLAAEGQDHKRQRRVATPAFSVQNMRALVPLVFKKGNELMNRWMDIVINEVDDVKARGGVRIDVCHWINRATFDVIGLAGCLFQIHYIITNINCLQASTTTSMQYEMRRTNFSARTEPCLKWPSLKDDYSEPS
jgi:Cytochrome P450